jgi:hypothetical protein
MVMHCKPPRTDKMTTTTTIWWWKAELDQEEEVVDVDRFLSLQWSL